MFNTTLSTLRTMLLTVFMCCAISGIAINISPGSGEAQPEPASTDSLASGNHSVAFRINASHITPAGRDVLNSVSARIDSLLRVDALKGISITGAASIDGPVDFNNRIARERAHTVRDYIMNACPGLASADARHESFSASLSSKGEDWQLLHALVMADSIMPQRNEVLRIMESSLAKDSKEKRLRALKRAWPYMRTHILPRLRRADVSITWLHSEPILESVAFDNNTIDTRLQPSGELIEQSGSCLTDSVMPSAIDITTRTWTRHYYIKTNLPAWLLLWTNIAGEADIAPHLSAELSVYYSGFDYFRQRLKFRTFTLMPELRFWPRPSNDGFFMGAHFGLCYYNIALMGDYRYQDHDGNTPALGGGLTVGYRLPLKNPRWKMEFSLGAGIYKLDYDLFRNEHNGMLTGRRQRTFYGIDRAAISLCYTFGNGAGKGGGK